MKKLYTIIAGALLCTGVVFGQGNFKNISSVPNPMHKGPVQVAPATSAPSPAVNPFTTKTPPVYSENFEGVTAPALPSGITTGGNTGSDFFKTGTSTDANAGGYWPVPAHTKFAMTNDDVCNCDKAADWLELPQQNFTGKTGLSISFAAVDDGTYGGGPATLELNINNAGWNVIFTMDQAPGVAWQNITVPLTGTDNQANVKLRFFYNDGGQWGTGFAVDDIVIDIPASNDLALTQKYFYGYQDSTATRYFTRIPEKQSKYDTLVFGGAFKNKGGASQANVKLTVNVTGAQTYTGTSTGKTVAAGANDSADINTPYYVAVAKGSHNINFAVNSDSTDAVPVDNILKDTINVTDTVYARDNNQPFSGGWYGASGETYIIGNSFPIFEQDSATSMSVFIGGFQAPYDQLGNTISFQLYELDMNGDWILMASKDFYDIQAADKGKWLTFPLTPVAPYTSTTLQAGGLYMAAFEGLSDTTLFVTGNGAPGAPPLTTFVNIAGTWYYAQSIPFIRLNTQNTCASVSLNGAVTQITCNGLTNGAINLTVVNGTSPITYAWSNSATTEDLSNLGAGTYSVSITDANSCTAVGSYTVNAAPAAIATAQLVNDTTTCGLSNGTLNGIASGGTAPFTYIWSSGQTTAVITGLAAGTYTLTVTDSKQCTKTTTVTVLSSTAVTGTTTSTNATCGSQDGTATVTASGGVSYLWNNGQTTATATGLGAGSYSVTVTDANGCTGVFAAGVSNTGAPTVAVTSSTNITCKGDSTGAVNITVSGGTTPYTYLWSNSATTEDLTNVIAGTYTVVVSGSDSCSTTQVITITEPATGIVATTVGTNVTCNGGNDGSINLVASGGTGNMTYLWSNAATTEDISGLSAGTYTVTVTDATGCKKTSSVTITAPSAVNVTGSTTNEIVPPGNNGAINNTVSGGVPPYTFLWSNNGVTEDLNGLTGGSYTVTVTDANGCTATSTYTLSTIIGINEAVNSADFRIFPNPTTGKINILFSEQGQFNLAIRNIIGQVVFNEMITINSNSSRSIDLSGIGQGIYFLNLTGKNVNKTQKLVIK